jgi:hypothetical protein
MTRGANEQALRKVLEDLEVRLETYLTTWREQLGIKEEAGAAISRNEQFPVPIERKKKGVR